MPGPAGPKETAGGDARESLRVLGRRWAREAASPDELQQVLRVAEGDGSQVPPSARTFVVANGGPDVSATDVWSAEMIAAFVDGVATSEGEE
jgi:hypothetical protein